MIFTAPAPLLMYPLAVLCIETPRAGRRRACRRGRGVRGGGHILHSWGKGEA